jgi:hypothetical protein
VKDIVSEVMRIYMDGLLIAETTGVELPINNIAQFAIGASPTQAQYMIGKVDDFMLYNYALSWGQVLTLYGQTTPLDVPLDTEADIIDDGIIDEYDLAEVCADWLNTQLFPI